MKIVTLWHELTKKQPKDSTMIKIAVPITVVFALAVLVANVYILVKY